VFQKYLPAHRLVACVFFSLFLIFVPATAAHAQVVTANPLTGTAQPTNTPTPVVEPSTDAKKTGSISNTPADQSSSAPVGPNGPAGPTGPEGTSGKATVSVNFGDIGKKPSQSVMIIVLITLISVAPALLIMLTGFTRIIIVLSLTRNALGVTSVPPGQVLTGLALFLSLFIMGPTLSKVNSEAIQPYMKGEISQTVAFNKGQVPIREFMLKHTRRDELAMFIKAQGGKQPKSPKKVSLAALVPAFIISELKTAFIIGFIIFIPFLVIDLIVSSSLMSMGMMMLPPMLVSLPFKILLFIMVDGWGLVIRSLLTSFRT
jgi:flagellar biosynthetic protein FliP